MTTKSRRVRSTRRSISALAAADVAGDGQRHFFAGVGGWSYALRLAGWPDGVSVWTGSCPCQPFSIAGHGGGITDVRHLWPEWFRLIAQCRPAIVFGEQVASGPGLAWLDAVFADLEGAGYACAAADLSAASVGAPHIRQRLYFVARRLGHASEHRAGQHARKLPGHEGQHAQRPAHSDHAPIVASAALDPWAECEWLPCRDGVSRPAQPGAFPLAYGVSGRVGQLRAYGNAIVPQLAAAFITAAVDAIEAAA